jgi:hypothetical protein
MKRDWKFSVAAATSNGFSPWGSLENSSFV